MRVRVSRLARAPTDRTVRARPHMHMRVHTALHVHPHVPPSLLTAANGGRRLPSLPPLPGLHRGTPGLHQGWSFGGATRAAPAAARVSSRPRTAPPRPPPPHRRPPSRPATPIAQMDARGMPGVTSVEYWDPNLNPDPNPTPNPDPNPSPNLTPNPNPNLVKELLGQEKEKLWR